MFVSAAEPRPLPPLPSPPMMSRRAARSETAAAAGIGAGGDARGPGESQVLHVRLVDLRQAAVALAGVIARICRPIVRQGVSADARGSSACAARHRRQQDLRISGSHFTVTR